MALNRRGPRGRDSGRDRKKGRGDSARSDRGGRDSLKDKLRKRAQSDDSDGEEDSSSSSGARSRLADKLAKRAQGNKPDDKPEAKEEPSSTSGRRSALAEKLAKRASSAEPSLTDNEETQRVTQNQLRTQKLSRKSRRGGKGEDESPEEPSKEEAKAGKSRRGKKADTSGAENKKARKRDKKTSGPRKPNVIVRLCGYIARPLFPLLAVGLWLFWTKFKPSWQPYEFARLVLVVVAVRIVWNLFSPSRFGRDWQWLLHKLNLLWRLTYWLMRRIFLAVEWLYLRMSWPVRMTLFSGLAGFITFYFYAYSPDILVEWAGFRDAHLEILEAAGIGASFGIAHNMAGIAALLALAGAVISLLPLRPVLWLYKLAAVGCAATWAYMLFIIIGAPNALFFADAELFNSVDRNVLWVQSFWLWVPFMLYMLFFLFMVFRRGLSEYYCGTAPERKQWGDRILENLRTHGRDPRYRTSFYRSGFAHIFVIFIVPFIMSYGCDEEPYGMPKGSGNPTIAQVKIKKPKKKPKKKIILNMNSAFIFYRPEIDDSNVMEEVEEATRDIYQASSLKGKLGKGGGKEGGWPTGMENSRIRFIRLEYGGGDWDQDMGQGADHNVLVQLHKMTGFKIADNTESRPIRQLRRFPPGRAPPFVFITGKGRINVSADDIKTLRWYCLEEGGMIFADNGGGSFNHHFRALIRRVFPEKKWVDISNDDIIYQEPFSFPNGAPPLWHHSGMRAMGIRHQGRWVVFYHQGDMNDAWKEGHSGVSEGVAMQSYKLAMNVMVYSFNQYSSIHAE